MNIESDISKPKIQMVDLHTQYVRLKSEIDTAIAGVLHSTQFIKGPQVAQFEKELAKYHDCGHVIAVGNGTDALLIALLALDLKSGDEIITPNFSYAAAAESMALLGIKPVLVDVDPMTMNIDAALIKNAISPATKAILPVHLFGQCANMEEIMTIAKANNLYVIEDNAQTIGAEYIFNDGQKAKSGTISHISTTSFFPSKNLGCFGDGGAILTNDGDMAEKIRMIANHGQRKKYFHERVGVNSRLDTLQAAILSVKLRYLDEFIAARQDVAQFYDEKFKDIFFLQVPFRDPQSTHVFHQYTLQLKNIDRSKFKNELEKAGIPSMVYYPNPLNKQAPYLQSGDFPVTESLCQTVISLPIHTEMNNETKNYIAKSVVDIVEKLS